MKIKTLKKISAYDHKKIEKRWQKAWEKSGIYKAKDKSKEKKYYCLIEFPYPSGDGLHVGHIRSNTAMDIISRKRRMEGYNVLYPIGWDAFGLPAENYAIKTGIHPTVITKKNTDTFRRQLKEGGFSFDWDREVNTSSPEYYKWTQWIFLQLLKNGLAYKKKMPINWCLSCKIGLANEEVVDSRCERCGGATDKREKEQWMLAITKYADRLDKDLDTVNYLPKIKVQQRNWIGRSEGAEIEFQIKDHGEKIKVFTTRPDTVFGATYLVLAPDHEMVKSLSSKIKNYGEVEKYSLEAKSKTDIERTAEGREKTGVELKGIKALNPASQEEIPIYIADYVLSHYGTGAIMAVPAHDERDLLFAKKYNLPVRQVIEPVLVQKVNSSAFRADQPYVDHHGIMAIVKHWSEDKYLALGWKNAPDWGTLLTGSIDDGLTPEETVIKEIVEETGYKNPRIAKYLGIIHGKYFHVPKNANRFGHADAFYIELANDERTPLSREEEEKHTLNWLTLPELKKFLTPLSHQTAVFLFEGKAYTDPGILVNSGSFSGRTSDEAKREITESLGGKWVTTFKLRDWVFSRQRYWGEPIPVILCDACGIVPLQEKDLPLKLPNVKNYKPIETGESPLAALKKWVNVKCPKCKGKAKRETDTMPNWAGSSWYFLRYVDPKNKKAFADKKKLKYWTPVDWYNGGMEHTTLHLLYSRFWHKFLYDIGMVPTKEPYQKRTSHGLILAAGGEKMSKSKGNVVNPDTIVNTLGADTLRVYEMFMGPFGEAIAWNTDSVAGSRRFLERVWRVMNKVTADERVKNEEVLALLNQTIKKVGEDIEEMKFNTAISALMILLNEFERHEVVTRSCYETYLILLAPFAPHITEELWAMFGNRKSIHLATWPKYKLEHKQGSKIKIVIQINSKLRDSVDVAADIDEQALKSLVIERPVVKKWLAGQVVKRVFVVKNKLVNIVT